MTAFASTRLAFALASVSVFFSFTSWLFAPPRVSHSPHETAYAQNLTANVDFTKLFVNIAKQTRPALVFLETRGGSGHPEGIPGIPIWGHRDPSMEARGAGSGFITDLGKGHVITNSHVVTGVREITVTTFDNRKFKASVLGTDPHADVAVLRLQKFSPGALKQVTFGNSDAMEVGDWVVALGAPFGLPQTLTHGLISAMGRGDLIGGQAFEDFIQTDAPINPGNSGGPLLNLKGEVIGVNTAISSPSGSSAGIGFAVPSHMVQMASQMLIKDGRVTRGYLGMQGQNVSDLTEEVMRQKKLNPEEPGAFVISVQPGSPAARAGLKPDDVILSIDGRPVSTFSQLRTRVAFMRPGTNTTLGVKRQGKPQDMKLEVGLFPAETETALREGETVR